MTDPKNPLNVSVHKYRNSPRLKGFDYTGPIAAHLTFVTGRRQPFFLQAEMSQLCLDALREAAAKHNALLHAYCIMLDHVHVLVEMPDGEALTRFARLFKQLAGYRIKQLSGKNLWQTSYYDHVLRHEEGLLDVARYIWGNPVWLGMVEDARDYRWSGPAEALWQV